MVSVGSKALPSRSCSMGRGAAAAKSKKPKKGTDYDASAAFDNTHTHHRNSYSYAPPQQQQSRIRKQVDPETTKYLSEIANLFENDGVELEERSLICANALEETKGKEFEVATDYILSHTLETILQGCDVDNLCSFLHSSARQFPFIAMDRSGSHVAQTAINSLAYHLQHDDARPIVEEALTVICKVIAANSVDVMCNCHGSHVLRTLLCLCKGVPLDKSGFYLSKSTTALAERLNFKHLSSNIHHDDFQSGFPNLLNLLVSEMFNHATKYIKSLQLDQFSSLVFQTTLRVLAGNDEMLLDVIPILLGCKNKNNAKGNFIESTVVPELKNLLKEPAFSHLMEVILEVSPVALFNELFTKVFRNSLFELSSHQHGNFVVQALISHASDQDLMELIWDELGPNMEGLFQMGRSGVVASLIAACERLHVNEHKCCQILAKTVSLADESSKWIVPRLLFLDSYFTFEDKSNWIWQSGAKMNLMGSLILQTIFRFNSEHIKPYVTSITSMDTTHVLQTVRDTRGSHVIEAFLCSGAPGKHKRRLVTKLQRHFGEVALHSSGAFSIEKCFTACNLSLRETIVSELLTVQSELSKTKQGSYLLRKLDVDGFAASPDHWRSKQASKESTYKEFYATFGSSDTKTTKNDGFLADTSNNKSNPNNVKEMRKEIDQSLGSSSFLSTDGFNRNPKKAKQKNKKNAEIGGNEDDSTRKTAKKRQRNRDVSEAYGKKLKTSD
ncbi:pumilio [Trifolium repens]|nr:pumilio [Trifolium repens]